MNAYEMADWIDNNDCVAMNFDPVAYMLRQQADRIKELEESFSAVYKEYRNYYEQVKQLESQVYGGSTK